MAGPASTPPPSFSQAQSRSPSWLQPSKLLHTGARAVTEERGTQERPRGLPGLPAPVMVVRKKCTAGCSLQPWQGRGTGPSINLSLFLFEYSVLQNSQNTVLGNPKATRACWWGRPPLGTWEREHTSPWRKALGSRTRPQQDGGGARGETRPRVPEQPQAGCGQEIGSGDDGDTLSKSPRSFLIPTTPTPGTSSPPQEEGGSLLPPHSPQVGVGRECCSQAPGSLTQRTNLSRADGRAPVGLAFSCFCGCCSRLWRTLSWVGRDR